MNNALDWPGSAAALTEDHLKKLAGWRGYSLEFCTYLRDAQLIGLHDGHIAFPLHGDDGAVVGCHYRLKQDRSWRYFPIGLGTRPLLIGQPRSAGTVLIFESQWDALAVMDRLGWHTASGLNDTAIIVTRGAANGKLVAGICSAEAIAYAWPQNDPPNLKTGKVPAEEWFEDVATQVGCKLLRIVTPAPFDDANDWIKSGATAEHLWEVIRAAQAVPPAEPAPAAALQVDAPEPESDAMAGDAASEPEPGEGDPQPPAFPIVSLPPALREFVSAIAAAHRVPEVLPACCALAAVAAAVGPGLELVSGPERTRTRPNIYILVSADSGSGKTKVFMLVLAPLFDHERALLEKWQKEAGPRKEAEEIFLKQQIEELKKEVKKAVSNDDRERLIAAFAHPKARLEELKLVTAPRIVVQDATIEALGVRLAQSHETLLSACGDARKLVDNLLGRNNPGKMVDDSLYLQAFSGDAVIVDRQSRDTVMLKSPCLTLLWMVQPDIIEKLLAEAALQTGGFLARLLPCHSNATPQEWTADAVNVPDTVRQQWAALLTDLLRVYHAAPTPHVINVPPEVWERFRAFHNPIVRRVKGADLSDVSSYAMRWTEQAMRLSLVHHAGLWGARAHEHELGLESAVAGIALAEWFAGQQLDVLARGRQDAHRQLEDRVIELIEERQTRQQGNFITARMVQNRHTTRTAAEAQALLARMHADGILDYEKFHRPEGGHVEHRYRLKSGSNPVPA